MEQSLHSYVSIQNHLQECFHYLGYKVGDLPEAERACEEVLSLPIYSELPADHLERVVAGIYSAIGAQSTLLFPGVEAQRRRAA